MRRTLVSALLVGGMLIVGAGTAGASNGAVTIHFEKEGSKGHYLGTACDGGTIEMQLADPKLVGHVQHFTATVWLDCPDQELLTASLVGRFNRQTGKTVLNGTVVSGWFEGAQVHEEGQLIAYDEETEVATFEGTIKVMPGSAA